MKYLPKELMNEIRIKYTIIGGNSDYDPQEGCRRIVSREIEKNAQIQSYEIENPHSRLPFSISRNNHKKSIKEGIKNIGNAFIWGVNNFDPVNFEESFIREIAGRIYPEIHHNTIAQYRTDNVRILGASKIPPDSYKLLLREIPWLVSSIKKQLSYSDVISKIKVATFSHLHLARIHPFDDGNGRTARTIQDIILTFYKIPVPLIPSGERHTYYACLDKAVSGWSNNKSEEIKNIPSEGENLFYTFIAGKINSSLDKLINRCNSY
jgi:Fic family protein